MWRKKKVCGFWDCKSTIPEQELLCADHKEKWTMGLIDRCPVCHRFKDVMYYRCQDCFVGRKVKAEKIPMVEPEPEHRFPIEYSEKWSDGDMQLDKVFVYIISFDDDSWEIGQTRDIRSYFTELKNTKRPADAQNPVLDYLEAAANYKAAEMRVDELKRLKQSNPGQLAAMTLEFHHHMQEFFGKD